MDGNHRPAERPFALEGILPSNSLTRDWTLPLAFGANGHIGAIRVAHALAPVLRPD